MSGTLSGTDGWFHNPKAQVSAHFGVGKDGTVYQWVDTAETAYHCAQWNSVAIGVEHEGQSGEALTPAQLTASKALFTWLSAITGVPLVYTEDPNGTGVIGHGKLPEGDLSHPLCPGDPILGQFETWLSVHQPPTLYYRKVTIPQIPWLYRLRQALNEKGVTPHQNPRRGDQYGFLTANRVIRFKRAHGLPSNATVDGPTWTALEVS